MRILNANVNRNPIDMTDEVEIRCLMNYDESRDIQEAIYHRLEVSLTPRRALFSDYFAAPKKNETKVIFNPPATILFMNGKKYVSKAHNEEFDEEKGLLMCLAKANGITHLQLKKMLKGAKRSGKTSS